APVRVAVTLRVTPDATQHRRPRLGQDEVAAARDRDGPPLVVDDVGTDAGERERRAAGLQRRRTGQGADHDGAGLGLPPRVDDGTTLAADVAPVPDPRLGVD